MGATALGLLVVFIGIASVIPLWRGHTPQYPSPDSIAVLEQITLGGSPQWVLIRGANRSNPLLLFLHGGPGMPTMYLAHDFQQELEQNFVVVQWDRRGAGKSFASGLSGQEMTVSREIEDTIELIDQLRSRLHQKKIYLVGFSYGSYLGILVAQRHPELLHAYIGIGQMACSDQESRTLQDTWIREQATRNADNDALDELNGRKPLDREKWLFKYGAEIHSARNWWPLLWSGLRSQDTPFKTCSTLREAWILPPVNCDTTPSPALSLKTCRLCKFQSTFSRVDSTTPIQHHAPFGCSTKLERPRRRLFGSSIRPILSFWTSQLDLPPKCGALPRKRCPNNSASYGAGLNKIKGFSCRVPHGAFYVFPNITKTGWPSKKLADALLDDAGVAALSGTAFGDFGEGYLRFSVANSIENIDKALDRIDAWTKKNL